MMDRFRRRMLLGMVVLVLGVPIMIELILAYHASMVFKVVMVVVNAAVLLMLGGLIVMSWFRRGTQGWRLPTLLIQVLLLLAFAVMLGMSIHQFV